MICLGENLFSCSAENLMGPFNLDTHSSVLSTLNSFFNSFSLLCSLFFGSPIIQLLDSVNFIIFLFFCFSFSIPIFLKISSSWTLQIYLPILLMSFFKNMVLHFKCKPFSLLLFTKFFYVYGILFSFIVLGIDYLGVIQLLAIASETWVFFGSLVPSET